MISIDEAKKIIYKIGMKHGVSPKLISERLLSDLDKEDMLTGNLSIDALSNHTEVWKASQMPDYAHGKTHTYIEEKNQFKTKDENKGLMYQKPFVPCVALTSKADNVSIIEE